VHDGSLPLDVDDQLSRGMVLDSGQPSPSEVPMRAWTERDDPRLHFGVSSNSSRVTPLASLRGSGRASF
jgi:hypothetical protein